MDGVSKPKDYVIYLQWHSIPDTTGEATYCKYENTTEGTILDLLPSTEYCIYVMCYTAKDNKFVCQIAEGIFVKTEPLSTPYLPKNVEVTCVKPNSITISWKKALDGVPKPDDFQFAIQYQKTIPGSKSYKTDFVKFPVTEATVSALSPSTEYIILVICRTVKDDQWVSQSEYFEVKTAVRNPDGKPTIDKSTVEITRISDRRITISWEKALDGVSKPDDYVFYVQWHPIHPKESSIYRKFENTTEGTIIDLRPSTEYCIYVMCYTAKDDKYVCQIDEGIFVKTAPLTNPYLPLNVEVTCVKPDSIALSWKKALDGVPKPDDFQFNVSYKDTSPGSTWQSTGFIKFPAAEATLSALSPSSEYLICIVCTTVKDNQWVSQSEYFRVKTA